MFLNIQSSVHCSYDILPLKTTYYHDYRERSHTSVVYLTESKTSHCLFKLYPICGFMLSSVVHIVQLSCRHTRL